MISELSANLEHQLYEKNNEINDILTENMKSIYSDEQSEKEIGHYKSTIEVLKLNIIEYKNKLKNINNISNSHIPKSNIDPLESKK